MNELKLQALIVSAVRGVGGYGFKLNNRFLGGIPDLLIHIPTLVTAIWEVKRNERREVVTLDLTEMQIKNLRDFTLAGGFGGVVSFVQDGRNWLMQAIPYLNLIKSNKGKYVAMTYEHKLLPRGGREEKIIKLLSEVTPCQ